MLASLSTGLSSLQLPLRIEMAESEVLEFGPEPRVTLRILDPGLLEGLPLPILDALAEAWVEKRLELDGPIMDVIAIADSLSRVLGEAAPAAAPRRGPGRAPGSLRPADLSNAFFRLWLDPEMVYSCAYFETGREELAPAQIAKLRHVCRKLRLQPGDYLLDAGCGWGALARLAAREFGVRVLGITQSGQQLELGRERVRAERLQQQVQLEHLDFHDLPRDGRFDKIASIGMVGHVGTTSLASYFGGLQDALRPGGLLLSHGITARDSEPDRGGEGFIQRHVFPQGGIPPLGTTISRLGDAGLEVVDVENLRPHYARTLECWSAALERHLPQARTLVPENSLRLWRLCLAGCAFALRRGWVQVHQVLAVKPRDDGSHELPWTRRDLYP